VFKAADVVAAFHQGAATWGFPASLLTDNAAVFTAMPRGGRCAIELETVRLGIRYHYSSPYHPQTCGKVERFHQTLKKWLHRQPKAGAVGELQAQLDRFRGIYNTVRPHRAIGLRTPAEAFAARPKATPSLPALEVPSHFRVRRDKVDITGVITLRHNSRLHHIGLGRRLIGTRVLALVDGLHMRVLTEDGELLRDLTLDPVATTSHMGDREVEGCPETCGNDVPRHHTCAPGGSRTRPPTLGPVSATAVAAVEAPTRTRRSTRRVTRVRSSG